jgi:hypothetical protein
MRIVEGTIKQGHVWIVIVSKEVEVGFLKRADAVAYRNALHALRRESPTAMARHLEKVRKKPLPALIEAGGVNDTPVVAPVAEATSDGVTKAIKTLRTAGYRISKPRKPKVFKRGKDRVGPTFVCTFADGVTTRMSVFTPLDNLDWARGVHLSEAAWSSRWRAHRRTFRSGTTGPVAPVPPVITAAHFEQDGAVLAHYPNGRRTP